LARVRGLQPSTEPAAHESREYPSAFEQVVASESLRLIYQALESLPEDFRVPLHLQVVEGLSLQEISAVTGTPVSTVGTRMHRGRAELKRLLGGSGLVAAWVNLERAWAAGLFPRVSAEFCRRVCTQSLVEDVNVITVDDWAFQFNTAWLLGDGRCGSTRWQVIGAGGTRTTKYVERGSHASAERGAASYAARV
jgi:hypothetical protein